MDEKAEQARRRRKLNEPVASNIERIIKDGALSRPEVARRAGLKPRQLTDMLNGGAYIKAIQILAIAEALRVNVNDLFISEDDEENYII
jgi:transcriptional regulator with XRE-family HTH domain